MRRNVLVVDFQDGSYVTLLLKALKDDRVISPRVCRIACAGRGLQWGLDLGLQPNAVKIFLTEYPAVLALATDFIASVARAKTAGTTDYSIHNLFTALASAPKSSLFRDP